MSALTKKRRNRREAGLGEEAEPFITQPNFYFLSNDCMFTALPEAQYKVF